MIEINHGIGNRSVGIRVATQNHHLQTQIDSLPEHAPHCFQSHGIAVGEGVIKQQRKTAVMAIAQGLGNGQANGGIQLFLEPSTELREIEGLT